jgi:hypothetical protein
LELFGLVLNNKNRSLLFSKTFLIFVDLDLCFAFFWIGFGKFGDFGNWIWDCELDHVLYGCCELGFVLSGFGFGFGLVLNNKNRSLLFSKLFLIFVDLDLVLPSFGLDMGL